MVEILSKCLDCGKDSSRPVCADCARLRLLAFGNDLHMSLIRARHAQLSTIYYDCPLHGLTLFAVHTGQCVACSIVASGKTRAAARRLGDKTYDDTCAQHGRTEFSVMHGKCLTCFNAMGRPRPAEPPVQSPRAAARLAGSATYDAPCPQHGQTAHHVRTGKCATCYTQASTPRRWGPLG